MTFKWCLIETQVKQGFYVSISDINNNSFGKDIIIQGSNMSEKKLPHCFSTTVPSTWILWARKLLWLFAKTLTFKMFNKEKKNGHIKNAWKNAIEIYGWFMQWLKYNNKNRGPSSQSCTFIRANWAPFAVFLGRKIEKKRGHFVIVLIYLLYKVFCHSINEKLCNDVNKFKGWTSVVVNNNNAHTYWK